jgi:hypothetical protein
MAKNQHFTLTWRQYLAQSHSSLTQGKSEKRAETSFGTCPTHNGSMGQWHMTNDPCNGFITTKKADMPLAAITQRTATHLTETLECLSKSPC